jgi:hypothetical protein
MTKDTDGITDNEVLVGYDHQYGWWVWTPHLTENIYLGSVHGKALEHVLDAAFGFSVHNARIGGKVIEKIKAAG